MDSFLHNITIVSLAPWDFVPYELLLLADPSRKMIQGYLQESEMFVAQLNEETIGILALLPLNAELAEIKNVAVAPELQGKGIGTALIQHAERHAVAQGFLTLQIGTANSSFSELRLYQKLGFEISRIIPNFFVDNYQEPIIEDGIQAKHMIMLSKSLGADMG